MKRSAIQDDAGRRSEIRRMYQSYRKDFPGIKEITAENLVKLEAERSVIIVDVREPEERQVSVIPGSISKSEFEKRPDDYKDKPIVVSCTIGYRSGVYTKDLQSRGFDAMNLEGSILAWVHAGQPVVDPKGTPTKRVHVYGPEWDLLPKGYTAVW